MVRLDDKPHRRATKQLQKQLLYQGLPHFRVDRGAAWICTNVSAAGYCEFYGSRFGTIRRGTTSAAKHCDKEFHG